MRRKAGKMQAWGCEGKYSQALHAGLHCLACCVTSCVQSPIHQHKLGGCPKSQLTLQRARGSYLCPQPWHLAGVSRRTSHLQHTEHVAADNGSSNCLLHRTAIAQLLLFLATADLCNSLYSSQLYEMNAPEVASPRIGMSAGECMYMHMCKQDKNSSAC
jgi:hypothetical protein